MFPPDRFLSLTLKRIYAPGKVGGALVRLRGFLCGQKSLKALLNLRMELVAIGGGRVKEF